MDIQKKFGPLSPQVSFLLNLIRVLSVQWVLVAHGINMYKLGGFYLPTGLGVIMLFGISGFLISYIVYSGTKNNNFFEYTLGRIVRIYTGLIPGLLFIALIDYLCIKFFPSKYSFYDYYSFKNFVYNFFLLFNHDTLLQSPLPFIYTLLGQHKFGTGGPLWTLNLEWWTYLTFGWCVYKWKEISSGKWSALLILLLVAIIPLLSVVASYATGLFFVWLLGAGALFIASTETLKKLDVKPALIFTIIIFLLFLWRYTKVPNNYQNDLILSFLLMISIFLLISKAMHSQLSDKIIILPKALQYMANSSYTLYVIHHTVLWAVVSFSWLEKANWWMFAIYFLLANCLAMVIAPFTEMKHAQLYSYIMRRFFNKK